LDLNDVLGQYNYYKNSKNFAKILGVECYANVVCCGLLWTSFTKPDYEQGNAIYEFTSSFGIFMVR